MGILDNIGVIGEVLFWLGAILGLALLIAVLIFRAMDGPRRPTHVTIIEDFDQRPVALWSVHDRTYTRLITAEDDLRVQGSSGVLGFVSVRDPERLEFHRHSTAERLCRALAVTMLVTAGVGFLASLLPLLR